MIPNQWYVVLNSNEVKPGRPVGVTRMGEKLVFWRGENGQVACLRDFCVHRGVALSAGKLHGDKIMCPFHGFEYDHTGRCTVIPANGRNAPVPQSMQTHAYATQEAHGFIYIFWGPTEKKSAPARFFSDIDEHFTYGEAIDPWNTHYARVIENQLDVAHLPFVHFNSIGRGNRTLVNGPLVEWVDADFFNLYVQNRIDDGTPPVRPRAMQKPDVTFKLEFLFPNLWENHISPSVRVVAAFVPVDDEHTLLYLRFYQNFVNFPLVSSLINRLAMPFNIYVAHQDRGIVQTQLPKRPELRGGEKLIQADQPIIAYRKRRQELIEAYASGQ